jgi:hypothetical protein
MKCLFRSCGGQGGRVGRRGRKGEVGRGTRLSKLVLRTGGVRQWREPPTIILFSHLNFNHGLRINIVKNRRLVVDFKPGPT